MDKNLIPPSQKLFPRDILEKILPWLDNYQAIILVGSRQTGKTSLIYLVIKHLLQTKKINPENIFYFDLEDFDNLNLLNQGVKKLVNYIEIKSNTKDKKYIFVDEIQYLDNPSNLIKLLVDRYQNKIKVFASGSSALTIKRKFKDSMAGRKISFEIDSLNFREFLNFKEQNHLFKGLEQYANLYKLPDEDRLSAFKRELLLLFEEFVIYGGYPAVVLEPDPEKKKILLQNLYTTYIRKDLNVLFDLENINAFNKLLILLALQIGNLVNIQNLTKELRVAHKTIERYFSILQETFIIKTVKPFYRYKKKELVKMPKVYFLDSGLRNRIINDLRPLSLRIDKGALIENVIYKNLHQIVENEEMLKYWRTKQGSEIDFIIDQPNLWCFEVKSKAFARPTIPFVFKTFQKTYSYQKAFLLNQNLYKKAKKSIFLPYYYL